MFKAYRAEGENRINDTRNEDGTFKSSVDKFFNQDDLSAWAVRLNANKGDLMLVMAGNTDKTRTHYCVRHCFDSYLFTCTALIALALISWLLFIIMKNFYPLN